MDTAIMVIALALALVFSVMAVHAMLDVWGDKHQRKRLAIMVSTALFPVTLLFVAGWAVATSLSDR